MDIEKLKKFLTSKGVEFPADADADALLALAAPLLLKMMDMEETEEGAEMSAEASKRIGRLEADLKKMMSAEKKRADDAAKAAKAEIVRLASAAGKVLPPDEVIAEMSVEALQKTADAAPATVKVNPDPNSKINPNTKGNENAVTLSAEDKEIASQMGIDEEQMKKFHAMGDAPIRD